jgi:diguanylate cyclase (GGDEF)-like protein/PAS domain S-box-containing protein
VQDKTITLIILDDSFDTEEKIVSTLRTQGYAARSSRVEDDEDLIEAIKDKAPDIVIYTNGMELITLAQTRKCIDEAMDKAPVPLIAVDRTALETNVVEAMRAGATDLTSYENMNHLMLVINREVSAYSNWKSIHKLKTAFNESEQRCASLLDSSRDAIAYVHEGMHVYSNSSYLELFGLEASDELEGMPILDMVAQSDRDVFKSSLRAFMQGKHSDITGSLKLIKPDGSEFDGKIEFSTASIEGETCVQIIIRQQQADSEELERQLKLMSQKDQLTGLFNRQYCLEQLEQTISDCAQNESHAALLEIQIDNFADIKQQLGVFGADKFLVELAITLNDATGKDDVLSRYMYSSFTIVIKNQDEKAVTQYAKKIQKIISDLECEIEGKKINTTCCIGVTLIDKDSPDCNEVLARAEKAANEAVEQGNNKMSIFVPEKGELTRHEVDTKFKEQITHALKNDKFVLHFQPIVSLHGDTDERYEVFIRMQVDEAKELVMPKDFLPAAERIGMAIAIDRWVLYRTITVLTERLKAGHRTHFFLKLSAASLKDDTLIDWLDFQIKEKKLPDNSLIFEVKENVAVTNLKQSKELADNLRKIKCGFVLDDFGTGTNPFQLLEHINVDYVRMEKSFMENLSDNPQNQEAIQKIAERAAEMGKFTIAQFVPDAGSLSILWGMGVNFIQGYFLQEPSAELNYDFTEMTG